MATLAPPPRTAADLDRDERIFLHAVSWEQYLAILAIRGERSVPRITYLEGELELMSPSIHTEHCKKATARLLEIYALERGLTLNGYGSWTIKSRREQRGTEPDECFVLGAHRPKRPDIVIEIAWSRDGIDKLEVYRKLRVREVWRWRHGRIEVHALRGQRYRQLPASELLPDLDLEKLAAFAARPDQSAAVRAFLRWLRAGKRRPSAARRRRS